MRDITGEPLEIERKYLILRPDEALLDERCERRIEIEQIYLTSTPSQGSRRIRHSRWQDGEAYYYSEKLRVTDLTRIEREREISAEEFEALRTQAAPDRRPILKTRWCVPYGGHTLEIDLFPFWQHQAFCEVELSGENVVPKLPDWITVLREVSGDKRYNNNHLARRIPAEDEASLSAGRA